MITIVEEKKNDKKKNEPYYLLVYNYMIGDAKGHTKEKVKVSLNNPFVERYVKLINSLKPIKGTWGLGLDKNVIYQCWKEKQVSEEDYAFLKRMMFDCDEYDEDDEDDEPDDEPVFFVSEKCKLYADEFSDGVTSDTEYSFLVFEGAELFYIDEFGTKKKTKFKKQK
jgi:hypothetical protein